MTIVVSFPGEVARQALRTLMSVNAKPDEEVEAALVVAGHIRNGTLRSPRVRALTLSALFRNRGHYRALALAEELSKLRDKEVRRLGLGLLRKERSLEDLELGLVLVGDT